jgi:repressor LexA
MTRASNKGRPRKNPVYNGPFNRLIADTMRHQGIERLEDFADKWGIGRSTIYDLVRGRVSVHGGWSKPSVETLVKLAAALNLPTHELLYLLEPEAPGATEINLYTPGASYVSRIGHAGAGPGQNHALEDRVPVPNDWARGRDLVAFTVRGDSMAGGKRPIYDGDTVIVDKSRGVRSGMIVVARLADDSYVCKAFKDDKFGKRLTSLNPLYTNAAPPVIPLEDVAEIIGPVVRLAADVEPLEE